MSFRPDHRINRCIFERYSPSVCIYTASEKTALWSFMRAELYKQTFHEHIELPHRFPNDYRYKKVPLVEKEDIDERVEQYIDDMKTDLEYWLVK